MVGPYSGQSLIAGRASPVAGTGTKLRTSGSTSGNVDEKKVNSFSIRGTGKFVNPRIVPAAEAPRSRVEETRDGVILNFVAVEARAFVGAVLGDLLKLNYTVHPDVKGAITIQTANPVPRRDVVGVVEQVLQLNGLTLIVRNGLYTVTSAAAQGRPAQTIAARQLGRLTAP